MTTISQEMIHALYHQVIKDDPKSRSASMLRCRPVWYGL